MSMTANTSDPGRQVDPYTLAYIGMGVKEVLLDGLQYPQDVLDGEWGLLDSVLRGAAELEAELERRYGPTGTSQKPYPFNFYEDVAMRYAREYARALAADPLAKAKDTILAVFAKADPEYREPPRFDIEQIKNRLLEYALAKAEMDRAHVAHMLKSGCAGLDNWSEGELLERFVLTFEEEPPTCGAASTAALSEAA